METSINTPNARRTLLVGMGAAAVGWMAAHRSVPDPAPARPIVRVPGKLPNPIVYTHDGRKVRFYDDLVRDKVVAINMTYAQCAGICPTTMANLLRVQQLLGERLGRSVFMYSITLTPEFDTPKVLQAYANDLGVKPGWEFLTGAPDDIELLRLSLGFFDPNPAVDADRTQHAGTLRVGNAAYDRWAMAPGLAKPEQIMVTINHVDRARLRYA